VHEFGLCEAIVDTVERRAAGRRVLGVRIRIGARHNVVEPAFEQAFSMVAAGTVAEGAEVEWIVVPVRARCRSCGLEFETRDVWATCRRCRGGDLDVEGGEELMLEAIEVATPNPARSPDNGSGSEGG
jgi:hydrogenase nickel incorporation protein HypA/HybF